MIYDKLGSIYENIGVQVEQVNPTYTSQCCSVCGWVRKSNRRGKKFKCTLCGFVADADLNVSNIALNLSAIGKKERLLQKNRIGFYWNEVMQEPIVPVTQ